MTEPYVILGAGFTGERTAARLAEAGHEVIATSRDPARLRALSSRGVRIEPLHVTGPGFRKQLEAVTPPGARVLLSIPTLRGPGGLDEPTPRIVEALGQRPARVVYLSTTGVYGSQKRVDENTPPAPETERQRLRLAAEEAVRGGGWSALILRAAAIYGPGRGVHAALREGRYRLAGGGANFVSRIHVDDFAEIAARALESDITGAFPVADEHPSTSREIAEFCAALLGIPLNPPAAPGDLDETRRADRRVEGSRIRELLGARLRHPSYREGIPAALAAERAS